MHERNQRCCSEGGKGCFEGRSPAPGVGTGALCWAWVCRSSTVSGQAQQVQGLCPPLLGKLSLVTGSPLPAPRGSSPPPVPLQLGGGTPPPHPGPAASPGTGTPWLEMSQLVAFPRIRFQSHCFSDLRSCPSGSPGSILPSAPGILSYHSRKGWLVTLCPFWFLQLNSPSERCDHKATRLMIYKRRNVGSFHCDSAGYEPDLYP